MVKNIAKKRNIAYLILSIVLLAVICTPFILRFTGAWFTSSKVSSDEVSLRFGSVGLGENFKIMQVTNLAPTESVMYHGGVDDAHVDDITYAGTVDAYYRISFDVKNTDSTEDSYSETFEKLLDFNSLDSSQVRDDWHIYGKISPENKIPCGTIRLSSETPNLFEDKTYKVIVTIDMIQAANLGDIEGVDTTAMDSTSTEASAVAAKRLSYQNLFYFKDWGTVEDTTGLEYTDIDANTCYVSGYTGSNSITTLKIPQKANGKKVVGIGRTSETSTPTATASVFPNTITQVIMSPYVIDIGDYAFYNLGLRYAESSPNLITIGKYAFAENSIYLKKIDISSSVTHFGEYAFSRVRELLSLKLPPNATFGSYAFQRCGRFPFVVFGEDSQLTSFPNFYEGSLKCLILPSSITSFSSDNIAGNSGLEVLKINSGGVYYSKNNCIIKKDGDVLVAVCKTSVIPSEVKVIAAYTFTYGLTTNEIIIPYNVNTINSIALVNICFAGLTGDMILTLQNPNVNIKNYCVNNNRLTKINYNGTVAQFEAKGWTKSVFTTGSQDIDVICTDGNYNGYKSA